MAKRLITKIRISLVTGVAQAGSSTRRTPQKKCSVHVLQKGRLNPVAQTEGAIMAQTFQFMMMTNEVGCRWPPSPHTPLLLAEGSS